MVLAVRTGQRMSLEEFLALPETNQKVELLDGEVIVMSEPTMVHMDVVLWIGTEFSLWTRRHGGRAYVDNFSLLLPVDQVAQPDVVLIRAEHLVHRYPRPQRFPPDLVVEVSSPTTGHRDLGLKRDGYAAMGIGEYWFVDLPAGEVRVHRPTGGGYRLEAVRVAGDTLTTAVAPGLALEVAQLLSGGEATGATSR